MMEYKELDDASLVVLAKTDKGAFGELYERYVSRIYNYIYYRTSNHHEAEDLTAKVFMRAMGHIRAYDERGVPFSAWLYRIAHNLVANWHRDRQRRKIIPLDDFMSKRLRSDMPEEETESKEEQRHLLDSIRRLPEDRQQLLILKYVERLSNAEIGKIMDRTEGAVKSLYYRTLSALREQFDIDEAKMEETQDGS
ncbi:MAG: sigma-70 family RNA polymerase sigma factor [Anaerolineae bacterium]|nr:MAG: sigma-70 family RNA polymerase sigma factor [Anaerolineae bacterium]